MSHRLFDIADAAARAAADASTTTRHATDPHFRSTTLPRFTRNSPHALTAWLQARVRSSVARAASSLARLETALLDGWSVIRRSVAPPLSITSPTARRARHVRDFSRDTIQILSRFSSTRYLALPYARLTPLTRAASSLLSDLSDTIVRTYSSVTTRRIARIHRQSVRPQPTSTPSLPSPPLHTDTPPDAPPSAPSYVTEDLTETVAAALKTPLPPEYSRSRLVQSAADAHPTPSQRALWELGHRFALPPTRSQAVNAAITSAYETAQLSRQSNLGPLPVFQSLTPPRLQGGVWADELPSEHRLELGRVSSADYIPIRNDKDPGVTFLRAADVTNLIVAAITKEKDAERASRFPKAEALLRLRRVRDTFSRIFPSYVAHDYDFVPAPCSILAKLQTLAERNSSPAEVNTADMPVRLTVDGRALPSAFLPRHVLVWFEELSSRHAREITGGGAELAERIRGIVIPKEANWWIRDVVKAFPSLTEEPVHRRILRVAHHLKCPLPTRLDPQEYGDSEITDDDRISHQDLHDIIKAIFDESLVVDPLGRVWLFLGLLIGARASAALAKAFIADTLEEAAPVAVARGYTPVVEASAYVDDVTGAGINSHLFFESLSEVEPSICWDDGRVWGPHRPPEEARVDPHSRRVDCDTDRCLDLRIGLRPFRASSAPADVDTPNSATRVDTSVSLKPFPAPFTWNSYAPRTRRLAGLRAHLRRAATHCSTLPAMKQVLQHAVWYARSAHTPTSTITATWNRLVPTLPWPVLPIQPSPVIDPITMPVRSTQPRTKYFATFPYLGDPSVLHRGAAIVNAERPSERRLTPVWARAHYLSDTISSTLKHPDARKALAMFRCYAGWSEELQAAADSFHVTPLTIAASLNCPRVTSRSLAAARVRAGTPSAEAYGYAAGSALHPLTMDAPNLPVAPREVRLRRGRIPFRRAVPALPPDTLSDPLRGFTVGMIADRPLPARELEHRDAQRRGVGPYGSEAMSSWLGDLHPITPRISAFSVGAVQAIETCLITLTGAITQPSRTVPQPMLHLFILANAPRFELANRVRAALRPEPESSASLESPPPTPPILPSDPGSDSDAAPLVEFVAGMLRSADAESDDDDVAPEPSLRVLVSAGPPCAAGASALGRSSVASASASASATSTAAATSPAAILFPPRSAAPTCRGCRASPVRRCPLHRWLDSSTRPQWGLSLPGAQGWSEVHALYERVMSDTSITDAVIAELAAPTSPSPPDAPPDALSPDATASGAGSSAASAAADAPATAAAVPPATVLSTSASAHHATPAPTSRGRASTRLPASAAPSPHSSSLKRRRHGQPASTDGGEAIIAARLKAIDPSLGIVDLPAPGQWCFRRVASVALNGPSASPRAINTAALALATSSPRTLWPHLQATADRDEWLRSHSDDLTFSAPADALWADFAGFALGVRWLMIHSDPVIGPMAFGPVNGRPILVGWHTTRLHAYLVTNDSAPLARIRSWELPLRDADPHAWRSSRDQGAGDDDARGRSGRSTSRRRPRGPRDPTAAPGPDAPNRRPVGSGGGGGGGGGGAGSGAGSNGATNPLGNIAPKDAKAFLLAALKGS